MIFVAKNADFSENKIGTVVIPEEITISNFTRNAINASGESLSEQQEIALEVFFRKIGAISNNSLWVKIKFLFIPMLTNNVNKAFVNYVDNNGVEISGVNSFTTAYECIMGKGIRSTLSYNSSSSDNDCPSISTIKDFIASSSGYTIMDYPSQETSNFNIFFAYNIDYLAYNQAGIDYKNKPDSYNHLGKGKGFCYGLTSKDNTNVIISWNNDGSYTTEEQVRENSITFSDIIAFYIFGQNGSAKTQVETGVTERTAHRIYLVAEPFASEEMITYSNACDEFIKAFVE